MTREEPATKTCCDGAYPLTDLYCDECGEALEETHYRAWIVATFAAAAGIEWWLAATNVLVKLQWSEVFMLEVFLLQIAYPLAKVVQKLRAPERPVLREMATVFADRWSRMLFIGAWAFIVASSARVLPRSARLTAENLVDPGHAAIRSAIVTTSLVGFALVSAFVLVTQGPRFFDLRIPNTLSPRHRA